MLTGCTSGNPLCILCTSGVHPGSTACEGGEALLCLGKLVFGILALELLLDPGIVLTPEAGEVLGDLDGALC